MSKYRINGLPWSSGLGVSVKDCHTAREVMETAGLNWVVKKCELMAEMPFTVGGDNDITSIDELNGTFARNGKIYRPCPNGFSTYRTDKNIPLGFVKSKYEVVQNMDAFNFFDDAIGPDKAVWQAAGMFGYGHKIFVSAKLPITTKVGNDEIDNYLVFSNSHDGTSSVTIMFTPIRVICTNMLNSAIKGSDSYIRIRHTESARERLQRGAEVLRIACEHATDSQQLYNALLTIKMSDEQVLEYIANLQLTDKERAALMEYDPQGGFKRLIGKEYLCLEKTKISVRKANQIQNMFEYYMDGIGQQHIGGTAWGAYNAVTGFYSNVANLEGEKRMDSLLYGSANSNMQKAFVEAFEYRKVG